MDDDIQLPPLPNGVIPGLADWIDDVRRAAVRYDRECRAKVDAKPVVHSATIWLHRGSVWLNDSYRPADGKQLDLRWTADGRVWINSERNRKLARRLRFYPSPNYDERAMVDAADALDGGVR